MTDNNNNNNNNNMKRRKEKIQNETIPYHDIRFKSTETVGYVLFLCRFGIEANIITLTKSTEEGMRC